MTTHASFRHPATRRRRRWVQTLKHLGVALLIAWPLWGSWDETHGAPASFPHSSSREELSGGAGTVFDTSHNAFGRPLPQMDRFLWNSFRQGKRLFTLPMTVDGNGRGLGPQFNADSCNGCHFKDGRDGRGDVEPPLLLRLSIATAEGSAPEPTYGGQLQTYAVAGSEPEGRLAIGYETVTGQYADGTPFDLRRPVVEAVDLSQGPFDPRTRQSVRMPPALVGLGLLESVPTASILSNADPDDEDGDGISGRAQWVPDGSTGGESLGRFGWKAGQPSLRQQTATALREDLGIEHPVLESASPWSVEGPPRHELSRYQVERLVLYTRLLAVPARRQWQDPQVLRGKALFSAVGCESCHHPRFETGDVADLPALSRQVIRPYSDLLLHDMGDGLADARPEHGASGREWRTAPLWGLGLAEAVSGEIRLLHDGRARSVEEAILWHGGEAESSRDLFRHLSRSERQDLLAFLASL